MPKPRSKLTTALRALDPGSFTKTRSVTHIDETVHLVELQDIFKDIKAGNTPVEGSGIGLHIQNLLAKGYSWADVVTVGSKYFPDIQEQFDNMPVPTVDVMRRIASARFDQIIRWMQPKVGTGDKRAAELVIRAEEAKAKIMGYASPDSVTVNNVSVSNGSTDLSDILSRYNAEATETVDAEFHSKA